MKRFSLALFLFAGLGRSFSFAQNSSRADPFGKYLASIKENLQETALVRIAAECGIDTKVAVPRYAQRPGERWIPVRDLSSALEDQETDFYGTVAAWHATDRILIERWGMELDTGDYYRMLFCLQDHKVRFAEAVDWSISVEGESATSPNWGYEQRWKVGQDGKYENVLRRFVDIGEHSIAPPKLDGETMRGVDWSPKVLNWKDTHLPIELLR
jgi:hypothetical protein